MSKKLTFRVDSDEMLPFPMRVDQYISLRIEGLTRSQFRSRSSDLKINNKKSKAATMVVPGDIIDFFLENLPSLELQAEELPLEILFENSDALVLNKARGMVVHPGPGNRSATLVNGVLFYVQKFEGFDEIGE